MKKLSEEEMFKKIHFQNEVTEVEYINYEIDSKDKYVYQCYLNGKFYGGGSLEYMNELFRDYVVTMQMYGKPICEFKVERIERETGRIL